MVIMNEWEKDSSLRTTEHQCRCSNVNGLFVPNRQLSFVIAGLIFLVFSTFMAGYFFGQRYAAEHFTHQAYQDSFADQIYSSMFSLSEFDRHEKDESTVPSLVMEDVSAVKQEPLAHSEERSNAENNQDVSLSLSSDRYYAQLIGFGTAKAAERFVRKLARKGIEVQSKKRVSKTAKGRTITWYQVVTPPYANKNDLETLVSILVKKEKLKDVRILTC